MANKPKEVDFEAEYKVHVAKLRSSIDCEVLLSHHSPCVGAGACSSCTLASCVPDPVSSSESCAQKSNAQPTLTELSEPFALFSVFGSVSWCSQILIALSEPQFWAVFS